MKLVHVAWDPDRDRFAVTGTHRGHELSVNAPHEGPPTGFSASELLLAGVGSCSAWDVVEILRKQRQDVRGVEASVTGEQATENPWPFVSIEIVYRVRGPVDRAAVERAVSLSVERYCSVIATVRGVASVTTRIELDDEVEENRATTSDR